MEEDPNGVAEDAGGAVERPLAGMSDEALEQALRTTENAVRKADHVARLVPNPVGPTNHDDPGAFGLAVVSAERLSNLRAELRREKQRRERPGGEHGAGLEAWAEGDG